MKKIGNTIIEDGIKTFNNLKDRKTVRAVIIKNNQVLMLYSKLFDDYTFPGGGIKNGENMEEALKRELYEELGANTVKIIKEIGYTEEVRFGIKGSDSTYLQTSYFMLCEIDDIGEPNFVGREKIQGIIPVWVNIDEAIKHNDFINTYERQNSKGFKTVLQRENLVLNYIKEFIK